MTTSLLTPRLFTIAALFLLLPDQAVAQPDFSAVKSEVSASWDRFRLVSRTIQIEGEGKTLDRLANDQLVSHLKFRHRSTPQFYLMESEVIAEVIRSKQGNAPSSTVLGFNSKYSFELKSPISGTGWRLTQTRMSGSSEPYSRHLDVNYHASLARALLPYQNEAYTPLTDLFAHASFKLIECVNSPDNPGCIRVRYEARTTPNHPEYLDRGWLDLDPAAAWSIRESDNQMIDGPTQLASKTQVSVALTDGVPLIKSHIIDVQQTTGGKTVLHKKISTTFTCSIKKDLPEAEFTLSAYGLPEPVGVIFEKPTPTYVWFVAAAGGCAILALVVGYLARRARRPAVPSTSTE